MVTPSGYPRFPWEVILRGYNLHDECLISTWCERTFGIEGDLWRAVNNGWQTRTHHDAMMINMAWEKIK